MPKTKPFRSFTGMTDPKLLTYFKRVEDDERRRRGEKTKLEDALKQMKMALYMNREK